MTIFGMVNCSQTNCTTASSTPSCKKTEPFIRLFQILAILLFCVSAHAEGIRVKTAEFTPSDDYRLNAYFEIKLNPTLEDALRKGISLNFLTEFELTKARCYWFDKKISEDSWHTKLSYNALTQQYRLSTGPLYQNFDHLEDAVKVLGSLIHKQVIDPSTLSREEIYTGRIRMSLDISMLPKPFQIDALASSEWNLDSDWYKWKFKP